MIAHWNLTKLYMAIEHCLVLMAWGMKKEKREYNYGKFYTFWLKIPAWSQEPKTCGYQFLLSSSFEIVISVYYGSYSMM